MKAVIFTKNHRVIIEAPKKATVEELRKRCEKYYPGHNPRIQ